MNRNTIAEDATNTPLAVDVNPIPLHLPVGSAIFGYSGTVWITQEGIQDDFVIGPGERFDVRSSALIVASATKGSAAVYVAAPADVAADADVFSLLRRRARRLRAEEFDRTVRAARQAISELAAATASNLRRMLASYRRVPAR